MTRFELWTSGFQKRPLYQLSHIHFPMSPLFKFVPCALFYFFTYEEEEEDEQKLKNETN